MSIEYRSCQVCNYASGQLLYHCKDHLVSKDFFDIVVCDNCGFTYTNPIPVKQEIHRYYQSQSYISHTDSKEGLINLLYHYIRKITLRQKEKLIKRFNHSKSRTLLDIGCGTGYFINYCQYKGWKVNGVEPDEGARSIAQKNVGNQVFGTLSEIPQKSTFDIITLWHVLEHIHEVNSTLENIYQLLNEKGILVIAVPNRDSRDAKIYKENWAAFDVPRHLYHFTKQSLTHLLRNHHFTLQNIIPMKFDAFYVSMISEKYKNSGTVLSLLNGFFNGLRSNTASEKNHSSLIYIFTK